MKEQCLRYVLAMVRLEYALILPDVLSAALLIEAIRFVLQVN